MRPAVSHAPPEIPESTCWPSGTLAEDNSGWREAEPSIEQKSCTGCGICYMYCPDGAISIQEGIAKVDYGFCKGCGICARMCGSGAITMGARR